MSSNLGFKVTTFGLDRVHLFKEEFSLTLNTGIRNITECVTFTFSPNSLVKTLINILWAYKDNKNPQLGLY